MAWAAALTFGILLPVVMVVANKSAPVSLASGAVLANLSVLAAGRASELLQRYGRMLRTGSAALLAGLVVWAVLSLNWTISPAMTLRGLSETLPEFVFGWAATAAWPLVARRSDLKLVGLGVVLAGILIAFEVAAKMPLHHLVGARSFAFDLKRSSIPPLLLMWPALALYHQARQFYRAGLVVMFAEVGAILSHSSASIVAILVGAAVYGLTIYARRAALWGSAALLAVLLLIAPWTGTVMDHLVSPSMERILEQQHAKERIAIWTAFEGRVWEAPWLGHGFDASFRIADAAGTPAGRPGEEVIRDIHPHNQLLQIWIDFGTVGALGVMAMLAWMVGALQRLPTTSLAPRLALLASATVMGLVGVQAWDAWWLASLATTGAAFAVFEQNRDAKAAVRTTDAPLYPGSQPGSGRLKEPFDRRGLRRPARR